MSTNYLIRSLAGFFRLAFWFAVIMMVFSLGRELMTKDGKIGPTHGTHHSNGYAIPVKLQLAINDSIVIYKADKAGVTNYYRRGSFQNHDIQSQLNTIKDKPNLKKTINKNEISIITSRDKSYFELTNSNIRSDALVQVKSTSSWMNIILFVNGYIGLVLTVFMFYFLKEIFKTLNKGLEFRLELSKKVKTLGLILIIGVVLKLFLSFVFQFNYDVILIHSSINDVTFENPTNLLIYPRLNFKLGMFLIGISLIILSALLKEGNRIQQENELTI